MWVTQRLFRENIEYERDEDLVYNDAALRSIWLRRICVENILVQVLISQKNCTINIKSFNLFFTITAQVSCSKSSKLQKRKSWSVAFQLFAPVTDTTPCMTDSNVLTKYNSIKHSNTVYQFFFFSVYTSS